jgi:hypothetical protein
MKYLIGESLEVVDGPQGKRSVQCTRCGGDLGASPAVWHQAAKVRILPAQAASPLMAILESQYRLKQLLCPSCGALLHTELVEIERKSVARAD